MIDYRQLFSLLCFLYMFNCVSANSTIPDSMMTISMDSLYKSFSFANNTESQELIVNTYLKRAKDNGSQFEMANAYRMLTRLHSGTIKALAICDTLIILTKDLTEGEYPAYSYYNKSVEYIYQDRIPEAVDQLLISKSLAIDNNNHYLQTRINIAIGLIYSKINHSEKAQIEFARSYEIFQENPEWKTKNPKDYLATIFFLAKQYCDDEDYASAIPLLKEGLYGSFDIDKRTYSRFLHLYGKTKSVQGNHDEAIDTLKRGLVYVREFETTYSCGLEYLAKALIAAGRQKESIVIFEELDSLATINNDLLEWAVEGYNFLYNYYKSENNQEKEIYYLTKKKIADHILHKEQLNIANLDLIVEKNEALLNQSKAIDSLKQKFKYASILLALCVLIIGFIVFHYLRRLIQKLQSPILATSKQKKSIDTIHIDTNHQDSKSKLNELDPEIVNRINLGLNDFEDHNKFTKIGYNLNLLAKELHTNSSYLSKVINETKHMNFTNYINRLRIEFILDKLSTEYKYRRYTIQALARESGFNSAQSFTRAFTKHTKKTPTVFIKTLNKTTAY